MPDETKPNGGPCSRCGVGVMRDTGASWSEGDEIKVLYKCDVCDATDTRNPEPPQQGDGS